MCFHIFPGTTSPSDFLPSPCAFSVSPYTPGLRLTLADGEDLSCSALPFQNVPPPIPRGCPDIFPASFDICMLPSPRNDRLGHPNHLSADNLTRL
jgi:hypothetical protein